MPAGFSGHSATRVDIWVPLAAAMRDTPGWNRDGFRNVVSIIARVEVRRRTVAAAAQASAALERRVSLVSLDGGEVAPTERRIAYALAGVSFLVLVIGLANAATLLLVRGTRRRRESAIRTALGATRGRLFARILLEAAILATMATAGALALSTWLGRGRSPVAAGGRDRERGSSRRVRSCWRSRPASARSCSRPSRARGNCLATSGPAICLAPATDAHRSRAYPMLLLVQTTLSVVLIAGAGMLGRSLYNLMAQDFGMRLSDVVLVGFEQGPGLVAGQDEIFRSALERVRSMPGVEAATDREVDAVRGTSRAADWRSGDGRIAERQRSTPVPHRGDAGVSRHPRHRHPAGPRLYPRRRARRAGRHRQPDDGADGVAGRERARQVHPDWLRSLVRSVHRHWSARAADDGAVPRGRRRLARRTAAVDRAGRRRRSSDAVFRAVLPGARTTRGRR